MRLCLARHHQKRPDGHSIGCGAAILELPLAGIAVRTAAFDWYVGKFDRLSAPFQGERLALLPARNEHQPPLDGIVNGVGVSGTDQLEEDSRPWLKLDRERSERHKFPFHCRDFFRCQPLAKKPVDRGPQLLSHGRFQTEWDCLHPYPLQ
jgi:hypothetical protein